MTNDGNRRLSDNEIRDLKPGDVIRAQHANWPAGNWIEGPLDEDGRCCGYSSQHLLGPAWTVVLVKRVPRPFYANHGRVEPVVGDVVRDGDGVVWVREGGSGGVSTPWWWSPLKRRNKMSFPVPLTLLVDGETGETV